VLVDDPCYFNFRALLRAHQVKIVSVPYTRSGPDVASFEAVLAAEHFDAELSGAADEAADDGVEAWGAAADREDARSTYARRRRSGVGRVRARGHRAEDTPRRRAAS